MKKLLAFLSILAIAHSAFGQELVRRSFLGIQMENLNDDVIRIMGLKSGNGVLINNVIPNSTASAVGFNTGDILLKINDQTINSTADAVRYVGAQKSNTSFTYQILRDKKIIEGKGTFMPYPKETYPDLSVTYTEVKTTTGVQRVIITESKKGSNGALVVFIGGLGCYSLDSPLDTSRSELQLLNMLARSGYTTIRIEKPGIGDGAGYSKPCNEIGFHEETAGYIDAIAYMKEQAGLKDKDIYIIGHSMGGAMAPLIAAKIDVKGIIAYGTIGSNFMEYLLKTRRTIGEAYDWPAEETDAYVKDYCECASFYFIEKMSVEQAAQRKADCRDYLSVFEARSRKYNDELYALNPAAIWKEYKGRSLIAYGKSDFIASQEDHEILERAINQFYPGMATLALIEGADHGMYSASSFQQARSNPGGYNSRIGSVFVEWLRKQS